MLLCEERRENRVLHTKEWTRVLYGGEWNYCAIGGGLYPKAASTMAATPSAVSS
jgi:hypothetical protein